MILFKRLQIGKKLIVAFLLVTILSGCSGVISLFLMSSADTQYSNALTNYGFSQGDIGLLLSVIRKNNTNIIKTIASDDDAVVQQAKNNIGENETLITQYMLEINKTLIGDQEKAYYKIITETYPKFSQHAQEVISLAVDKKDKKGAMDLYLKGAADDVRILEDAVSDLLTTNKVVGSELSDQLTAKNHITIGAMSALIAISIGLSLLLAINISRSIAKPMGACSKRLVALADGDLVSPVPIVDSRDETGVLAEATSSITAKLQDIISEVSGILGSIAKGDLNVDYAKEYNGDFAPLHTSTSKIIDSLNDAFHQFGESADQVSDGSEQVSSGAQALSQGTTEQASSVEELAATINEISSQVNQNASRAQDASQKVNGVGEQLTQSNSQMQDMIVAMREISSSSSEIGKIIKTIEDIAFQTNILALNAAVEAARAGEAGKGFAVVADEVRNLASKSAEASKSTAILIESSLRAVDNGSKIADETANSLMVVVEGTKEITQGIDQIAAASKQQAQAIDQITQGIDQISSVVQTNSATAEESAAASEELSGQAQVMKGLVNRFKLKESGDKLNYSHTSKMDKKHDFTDGFEDLNSSNYRDHDSYMSDSHFVNNSRPAGNSSFAGNNSKY